MILITVWKHDLTWIYPLYRRAVILQHNIQGMHDVFHEEQEQEQQQKQTQQQQQQQQQKAEITRTRTRTRATTKTNTRRNITITRTITIIIYIYIHMITITKNNKSNKNNNNNLNERGRTKLQMQSTCDGHLPANQLGCILEPPEGKRTQTWELVSDWTAMNRAWIGQTHWWWWWWWWWWWYVIVKNHTHKFIQSIRFRNHLRIVALRKVRSGEAKQTHFVVDLGDRSNQREKTSPESLHQLGMIFVGRTSGKLTSWGNCSLSPLFTRL